MVHQVVQSMLSSIRKPYAHTKTRGEVRGGGKKPWQQRGTGRARHGSSRSPIWVGGGVTHGPRNEKNFDRKVNAKMKAKALYTISLENTKTVKYFHGLTLTFCSKTKEAKKFWFACTKVEGLNKLSTKKSNAILVAMNKRRGCRKGFRNFGNVKKLMKLETSILLIFLHTNLFVLLIKANL